MKRQLIVIVIMSIQLLAANLVAGATMMIDSASTKQLVLSKQIIISHSPGSAIIEEELPVTGDEESATIDTEIFPNPFDNLFIIQNAEAQFIQIFSSQGKLIFELASPGNFATIDFRHMPGGSYFVYIKRIGSGEVIKILKH